MCRPGWLGLRVPDRPDMSGCRTDEPMRSVKVDIPRRTFERTAEQLGGHAVDYERMATSVATGDPLLVAAVRSLAATHEVGELYAESAAAFLAVHLLTRHSGRPDPTAPVREDARIRTAVAVMRDRLADPLTLAEIAGEVHLSVYHLVRVFRNATGETPHRFLTRLRIEEARRLLRGTDLPIADIAPLCGFASAGELSTAS